MAETKPATRNDVIVVLVFVSLLTLAINGVQLIMLAGIFNATQRIEQKCTQGAQK